MTQKNLDEESTGTWASGSTRHRFTAADSAAGHAPEAHERRRAIFARRTAALNMLACGTPLERVMDELGLDKVRTEQLVVQAVKRGLIAPPTSWYTRYAPKGDEQS